jgi:hypothetical protein
MRRTIGAAAVTCLLSAALVGCGGDDEPTVCSAADELQASVDDIKDMNVSSSSGVDELELELEEIEAGLANVKTEAEQEFSTQLEAVDTAFRTLVSSVDAATADPSTGAVAAVGTSASTFSSALQTLIDDVQSTC